MSMKIESKIVLSAILTVFSFAVFASGVPEIRYTAERPFAADGGRIEAVWKKADVCTRFLEVIKNDVAVDQTEARLLFDDENLYVTMKGWFDPAYDRGRPGSSEENNFEVFVRPVGESSYLQVIAKEFGDVEVLRSGSEVKAHKVTLKTERAKGCWTADIVIPFATVGVAAPKDDLNVKVGLFRGNINVHERQKLFRMRRSASSFSAMERYRYSVPDTWADMVLTRKSGPSRRMSGPERGMRVNLLANPDFDVPGRCWSPTGSTVYQETMAMSGEWIYRTEGNNYQSLFVSTPWMKPSTRYTLVVKARSFGAGSAMRIITMLDRKNGGNRLGVWPSGNQIPVGPEMHEYYIPFTSSPELTQALSFYKVDDRKEGTGIEFASIRLYEGEISSFEIRQISRPGRMATIPGTEMPVTPSAYGRYPKPLKALVLTTSKYLMREPEEIFAGTGAEIDVLLSQGKDQDIYLSDVPDAQKTVAGRLEKGEYDLYMIPAKGASQVGRKLAGLILENVKKGAGLYLEKNVDLLHFKPVGKGGKFGKGRVHHADLAGAYHAYLPHAPIARCGPELLPYDRFFDPQVAADAYRTAFGGDADIVPAAETVEEIVYAGVLHRTVKGLDAQGRTVSWVHRTLPLKGAKIGTFQDTGDTVCVAIDGETSGVALRWELSDFSRRVLARGEIPAAPLLSVSVPRSKLHTNYGGLRLELWKDGKIIDRRGECLFARGKDRERLFDDFTPSMWPPTSTIGSIPIINSRLHEIGIRSSVIPMNGYPAFELFYSTGTAVGGNWIGGSGVFGVGRSQKGNIRERQFNTAKARRQIAERALRTAESTKRFGILHQTLCDEPNLSRQNTAFEVDAHPENVDAYRRYMKAKYGTIAEYNRRHETSHGSFDELGPVLQADARKSGKFAEFIEWRNFNVDRWCEAIKLVSDNAYAVDPEVPFSMCNSFGQSALSGNDYYKLLTRAGLDFSCEYTSMVYFEQNPIFNFDEFYRSFRPDMRVWGWTGYFYTPERARFMPWWFACHRYGGFSWYSAVAWGYNIADPTTFALTVDGMELKKSLEDSRLLDGLGKVLTCWRWAAHDTAVYYSHDSLLLATILGKETKNCEINASGPLHDLMYSRQGAQYTIEELLYQYDFIAPEQIVLSNRLSGVKALVMPRVIAMSDGEVAKVKVYLASGGKMLCDVLPGDYDELGVKRAVNPFAGMPGVTVFGRNFSNSDPEFRTVMLGFLRDCGATAALGFAGEMPNSGREAMHYVSGDADVYTVLRMLGRSQDDNVDEFVLAKKGHVYDVRNCRYLGETDRVRVKAPLHEAAVFAVLPWKPAQVKIDAPDSVDCGDGFTAALKLWASDAPRLGNCPAFVLHVEFIPPSGKIPFHFKRNLMTKNSKVDLTFPIAFNDEKGEWKMCVSEPLTGTEAEHVFNVR